MLARAAMLQEQAAKKVPLHLRVTARTVAGLAGELLPVVGPVAIYQPEPEVRVLAYLSHPSRFEGESVGITETEAGEGRIIAFAFDLARCVLMLRQGDPARAEWIPAGDSCARPSHMAAEIATGDAAWVPFADLLGRLLVDLVRDRFPAPLPLLSHLPGVAPGIVLYSGDEDGAEVAWNDEELGAVAAAGGRMNLYLIPTHTHSAVGDVRRYSARHDVGPHPNLRPLDGRPVGERLAEFERQFRLFEDMFGVQARTVRNHCTAWAGYLELVEVMERQGVRMDANYFSGTYLRDRQPAPYAAFGAALPMRFCQPDGRILDVYQQHTHLTNDGMFGPADYSYKLSPASYRVMLDRILGDIVTRLHIPYAVCIHPSNWVRFSRPQGQELLRQANERGLPVWSFDQWLGFWKARDTWRLGGLAWDGTRLQWTIEGKESHDGLCLALPLDYRGTALEEVRLDRKIVSWQSVTRYGEHVAMVPIPTGRWTMSVSATYGEKGGKP